HVEKLVLRQREFECVFTRPVGAAFGAAAALAALGPRDLVAADVFLVARDDVIAAPGAAIVVKDRLRDPAGRDRNPLAVPDIGDLALAQRLLHGGFDLYPGPRQKPLAVAEALALRVGPAIDNVHRTNSDRLKSRPTRPCSPAYTTRPGGAPGAQYSH